MITAKLNSYSPFEVDKLGDLMKKAYQSMLEHCYEEKTDCATCTYRHVCYDIHSLCEYLQTEKEYGYPHAHA